MAIRVMPNERYYVFAICQSGDLKVTYEVSFFVDYPRISSKI